MRIFYSYGSILVVLIMAVVMLPFSFLSRGFVLKNKNVTKQVNDAVEQVAAAEAGQEVGPTSDEIHVGSAMQTVKLGGRNTGKQRSERASLLDDRY